MRDESAASAVPGLALPGHQPPARRLLGPAPLRRRLGLGGPKTEPAGPGSTAPLARTAFYLLASGATVSLISLLFDAGPGRDDAGVAAAALAAYPLALICIAGYDRLSESAYQVISIAAVTLVSLGLYYGGSDSSYYRMFYVWIALFAAYHFRPLPAALQVVAMGVGYGLVVGYGDIAAGPLAWLLTTTTLVVIGVITILLRNRVEAQLDEVRRQNLQLLETDRLKDEFLATVSHELRTPLTSIRGYLELALEPEASLTPDLRNYLEVIDRNSERLLRQVSDLLLVAQIEARAISIEKRPLDIVQVAESTVGRHVASAEAAGVTLTLETLPVAPVSGDAARLAQLLDVLVGNALKFTPQGGSVWVRIRPLPSHGVEIEVADNGSGVPEGEQERLFERFYRASGVTDRAVPGTGIGLTIARGIAEAHGGTIGCTSVEGAGSTFRVTLPEGTA